jgi:hypothetical protein
MDFSAAAVASGASERTLSASEASPASSSARPIPEDVRLRILEFGKPLQTPEPSFLAMIQYSGPHFVFRRAVIATLIGPSQSKQWHLEAHTVRHLGGEKFDSAVFMRFTEHKKAKGFVKMHHQFPLVPLAVPLGNEQRKGQSVCGIVLTKAERQAAIRWVESLAPTTGATEGGGRRLLQASDMFVPPGLVGGVELDASGEGTSVGGLSWVGLPFWTGHVGIADSTLDTFFETFG